MSKLGKYTCDEALNVEYAGGDSICIHNNGDGSMVSRDVTNNKKIMIKFGTGSAGILSQNVQQYGLTFSRNASETFTLPESSSLHFELNKGLIEIDIPTMVNGVEVNKSNGDTIYMNFRGGDNSAYAYSITII